MLPGASSIAGTAPSSSLDLSYHDSLALAEATERLEQQMEKAGSGSAPVSMESGIRFEISTDSVSCIVHIADADSGSRVRIGCAPGIGGQFSCNCFKRFVSRGRRASGCFYSRHPGSYSCRGSGQCASGGCGPETSRACRPAPANPIGTEIEGWSQARWGMTQSQLLKAFPGEAKILTGDLAGRRFGSRGIATVEISGADIEEFRFACCSSSTAPGNWMAFGSTDLPSPSDEQFKKMETAMEGVYKTPSLRAAMGQSALNTAWLLPNSVVELAYVRTELLNLCIDRRSHQTKETVREFAPGFTEVRGTGQLSVSKQASEKNSR